MRDYFVRVDLFGIKAGRVERFADQRAAVLVRDGFIEPFDAKNGKHAAALRAQEKEAADRKAEAEVLLREERENPAAFQARELARRRTNEKRIAAEAREEVCLRLRDEQEKDQVAKRLRAKENTQLSAIGQ